MTKSKETPLNIKEAVNRVLSHQDLTYIKVGDLERSADDTYSLRLQSTGERGGYADIKIQQKESGRLFVNDVAVLPDGNHGFEPDIALLKKFMFYDKGAGHPDSGVRDLMVNGGRQGEYTVSFEALKNNSKYALHHYLNIAVSVMNDFFEGMGSIDLAFSLARERAGII